MIKLPKKHLQSPRGQILILFLLVLVLATAIVLSVASRTVTDIKVTSTSDESNRAYFAAEAGVEEALKKAETSTGPVNFKLAFDDISTTATTELMAPGVGARETYVYPFLVERDDVAQINMLRTYHNLNTGWLGSNLAIYWGTDPAGANGQDQAIEVSILYHDGAGFHISKFGFDPNPGAHPPLNNFCSTASGVQAIPAGEEKTDSVSEIPRTVHYEVMLNIETGDVGATGADQCGPGTTKHGPGIGAADPVFLRIRPLYNTDPVPIVVETGGASFQIPNQGDRIESVGKTDSGVTRKIEVVTTYPAMPAIFDYVLFNGGSFPLEKPPP